MTNLSGQVFPNYVRRMRALRAQLSALQADSALIANPPDIRYLCGFTGSNAALAVASKSAALFTDGRYTAQAHHETQAARVKIVSGSARKAAIEFLARQGSRRCLIDSATTTLAEYKELQKHARAARVTLVASAASPVLKLRQIKDAFELARMREAAALGCELYLEALTFLAPGIRESTIAARLEHSARERGAEKMSFDTIVASGERSSHPHGRATLSPLPRRGFVTLDFGVILNGYCSDMTRTIHLGKPSPAHQQAYEAVLAAQENAVAAVRPGATCAEVDEAARGVLRKARLAKWFTHSTGHGVGLEVHEPPRIAAKVQTRLEPGMVVTIEPGVYLPGKFGIRIEDMVAVTDNGHEVLTPAPKGWTALA